jgi:methylated-DNA-[protein]-cysteine S-methyltransferase
MNIAQFKLDSIIGPLFLVASEKGLCGIFWKKQTAAMVKSFNGTSKELEVLRSTVKQLEGYFSGKRKSFNIAFDIQGTDFQKRVWEKLSQIPYGKTNSYKQIAMLLNSKAFRAVGSANGRNPLSIIVPCHRVIAANGTLGGYAGGLKIKKALLAIEHKSLTADPS